MHDGWYNQVWSACSWPSRVHRVTCDAALPTVRRCAGSYVTAHCSCHATQASAAPSDQPKVNTTASEYYVLQYSVRFSSFKLCSSCLDKHGDAALVSGQSCFLVLCKLTDMTDAALLHFSVRSGRHGEAGSPQRWPPRRHQGVGERAVPIVSHPGLAGSV